MITCTCTINSRLYLEWSSHLTPLAWFADQIMDFAAYIRRTYMWYYYAVVSSSVYDYFHRSLTSDNRSVWLWQRSRQQHEMLLSGWWKMLSPMRASLAGRDPYIPWGMPSRKNLSFMIHQLTRAHQADLQRFEFPTCLVCDCNFTNCAGQSPKDTDRDWLG